MPSMRARRPAGLLVPCGEAREGGGGGTFLHHNEYIVYDPAQVRAARAPAQAAEGVGWKGPVC